VHVVDASVVIKWVLPETGRRASLALLDAYEAGETDLLAPRLLREEVASAISRRCRLQHISPRQARAALEFLEPRMPLLIDSADLASEAFEVSANSHLSLWDGLYLVLAMRRRCELVTADPRFYRAARQRYAPVFLLGN